MVQVTDEMVQAMAKAIMDELDRQEESHGGFFYDTGDLNGVGIDGRVNVVGLACAVLAAATAPAGEEVERVCRQMENIASASTRKDGSDIPLGEQCRNAASLLRRLSADLASAESARDAAIDRAEKAEAGMARLLTAAKLLQDRCEIRAIIHYGADFAAHGMPGWLVDTAKDIAEAARLAERTPA